MRKIYVFLLILGMLVSISVVSANENVSMDSDSLLETHTVDEISQISQNETPAESTDESCQEDLLATTESTNVSSQKTPQVPSKATTKNIKSTYGTKAIYTLKLFDKSGKAIVGKEVKFKIGKKVYKIKTDSNGVATLNLNYAAGKYIIKYSVGSLTGKNTYIVKNKITMTILKWGNKGDVSKIKLIRKNMPKNEWVKKAVKATKKGNPLLTFEGGKGKKVFITAGVHGNELSSQVAVMRMIAHLCKTPIKGTVYIIPFVNIKAITHKQRHTGTDYNRVAHKSGTISHKIVKLVVKFKCDAYGDFHTTQPGGVPGKNIVMGSKTPAKKSAVMTKYIAGYAKVNKRIYKYAGEQYPGALEDNVNKHRIASVICEVVLPHNTVTSKSVSTSYKMVTALLKFNSII